MDNSSTDFSTTIAIIASGAFGSTLADALKAAGFTQVALLVASATGEAVDLTIVALEDVTWRELLNMQATLLGAGHTTLFLTIDGANVVQGTVTVPGLTACVECRLLQALPAHAEPTRAMGQLGAYLSGNIAAVPAARMTDITHGLVKMVAALSRNDSAAPALTAAAVHRAEGTELISVLPVGHCTICSGVVAPRSRFAAVARTALARALELEGFAAELAYSPSPAPHPDRYRTVGILGGGTAGYLAALTLRRRIPDLEVTLIESSKIPIISVGEATTPEMVRFLHSPGLLGLDIADFHRRVQPSIKLGIQFLWGATPDSQFSYPFQYAPLVDPMVYDGHLDNQSVAAQLMYADRAPLLDAGGGRAHSLLESVRFAYHLDNERFVAFLKEEAISRGIHYLDAEIRGVEIRDDGENVDHLVTADGRKLQFDLYVDASGFRSVLMEGALKSPFVSYQSSLFTDRAIATNLPHDGLIKPYTRAHAFDAGWCWSTAFEDRDHIGYVYASSFISDDAAVDEMHRMHPRMGEPRQVKFRSGRHAHFFKGNVVALGNSYAFVEPLESTALHMVIYELEYLTNHFPLRSDVASKARLTEKMNDLWDQLRWFLAIHYRFNRRLDTEFWRAARADADISGARDRLELFCERAPLSDRPSLFYSIIPPDFFSGDHAFDTLLLGQGVPARLGPPRLPAAAWHHRAKLRREIAAHALPLAKALPLLRDVQPELLTEFMANPRSWVQHWIAR
ncbi:MAG: tryptophan 7-halogenase [Gammaproteobacteria bacterium]|nr:tryptophan 7-halogenase [Gammaproteobacteria bacterium]